MIPLISQGDMDRFAANTLRTLGIIATAICVILGCGVLLLLSICFSIIAKQGNSSDQSTGSALLLVTIVAGIALVSVGVFIISTLAKGMVRANSAPPPQPYTLIPPPSPRPAEPAPPASDEAKLDHALASLEAMAKRTLQPPSAQQPKSVEPPKPVSAPPRIPSPTPTERRLDIHHLSPASRTVIQQLATAIAAKILAEVALGVVGWFGALGVPPNARIPFPLFKAGFLAWGLAAIAPHLVLLYALARRPGPRAFAYALVIPSLHLLFGIFGHSAFLAFILRAGQLATPLLSLVPWLLDILILYLAWKAIRQTGIEPSPTRLIVASVVIFVYTSFLPLLVVVLNQWR